MIAISSARCIQPAPSQFGDGTSAASDDRGVALVITLLLVSLFSIIGLAMVLAMSSDMLINGYYKNYRGAFYAADSGLAIARQELQNQIVAQVPNAFTIPPVTTASATTALNYINSTYGGSYSALNTDQAAGSWGGGFEIANISPNCNVTNPVNCFAQRSCTVTQTNNPTPPAPPAQPACPTNDLQATQFKVVYQYSLTSNGRALSSQVANAKETGTITVVVTGTNPSYNMAGYGMFIDQSSVCNGSYLVPGTITGPVFTNGSWTFGTSGSYVYTDQVQSAGSTFGYQFSSCKQASPTSPNGSYTYSGQTINPRFKAGFKLGAGSATLPPNSFAQEWAVIDGKGTGEGSAAPTATQMHGTLENISGAAYPTGGASSGVYLPYCTGGSSCTSPNTVTGGGIYVEGDAGVQLTTGSDNTSNHNPTQIFTITQGSHPTTTTVVTVNVLANTTTFNSLVLTGVPTNQNLGAPQPSTMLYVNGNITSLNGPGQGSPAIQDASLVTITALKDITITGDLLYKAEPVTFSDNQVGNLPMDSIITANDTREALGIFTATGNINLQNAQSNNNLEIDATLATISQNGNGALVNTGDSINTLNIVGGRIQNTIQDIGTTTRNVYFDRRFGNGFGPPWFPSTTMTGATVSQSTPSVQRLNWVTAPQ